MSYSLCESGAWWERITGCVAVRVVSGYIASLSYRAMWTVVLFRGPCVDMGCNSWLQVEGKVDQGILHIDTNCTIELAAPAWGAVSLILQP